MKSRISSGLLLLFIGVQLAYSKGSPDLIVITGGGLIHQIDITDPATLKEFDPWQGQFADWQKKALVDAPCFRRSFEVLFYMSWPERKSSSDHPDLGHGDLKMIYATRYCSTGSTGYVYLPARARHCIAIMLAPSCEVMPMVNGIPPLRRGMPCWGMRW